MELLLVGAVVFFIGSQLMKFATPLYLKIRLSKSVKGQSVRLYRQKLKSQRKLLNLRRIENNTREMILTSVTMGAVFMTPALLLAPYPSLSALIIFAALVEFNFYSKIWFARRLPLFTFFSVDEEPFLFNHLWEEKTEEPLYKRMVRLSNEKMVRVNVLKDFVPAKKLASDLRELDASIAEADNVIREMKMSGVDAKEVQAVRQQALELSASMKKRLSIYPDLLLHLLDASSLEYSQAKEKEEAGERVTANMMKAIRKLADVEESPDMEIIRNPAVEDMVRIIESADVDNETRAFAEKTLKEIQERMNREAEEREEQNILSNAQASIQTARKLYSLDSEEALAS